MQNIQSDSKQPAKKPYTRPKLTKQGTVESITQQQTPRVSNPG